MGARRSTMLRQGALLPRLELRDAKDHSPVHLPSGRGPLILLLMHSGSCAGCVDYLRTLADMAPEAFGARIVGVLPGFGETPPPMPVDNAVAETLLIDAARILADGVARIIAADEWGEIFSCEALGPGHDTLSPSETIEWARFIAIQCPECEGPEGDWR